VAIIIKYEIKKFKSFNKNTLRGFFTLRIDAFEIESFTYHEKGDKRWIGLPSKEVESDDGEKAWFPTVRIPDKNRYYAFQKWAITEIKKLIPETMEEALSNVTDDDIPF